MYVVHTYYLQGLPTHIDAFQMNIFSWFNDTVIQSQWFLGLWDREIWYKTLFFHFINLTWPPRPQKEKIYNFWRDVGVGPPWVCHALVPRAQSSWVLGLSYEVYIFSVLALVLSEIDQRQEATLFLFSLSFEYGCEKSVRQLTGFFRYVEIVITKLYVYLNWMFYIKSPYLRISKISSFLS